MNLIPKGLGLGNINSNAQSLIAAGLIGIAAAYAITKLNLFGGLNFASPAAVSNAMAASGAIPVYSRGFPDQSIKANVVPTWSMGVESWVPYDSSGRFAKVAGPYDGCDKNLF